jgi:putative tryptophan/tyrosine transport system substrate-binding protein
MRRRTFIAALGGAVTWPLVARAQQPGTPVIGFLNTQSPDTFGRYVPAFGKGLKEMGYVEGQNVAVVYRWAEGNYNRLPALATELVERHPTVIAATGGLGSAAAAKAATMTIPIVFEVGVDPVTFGLVSSLNRPERNVTGFTLLISALPAKRLELLRELVPSPHLIAALLNPNNPSFEMELRDIREASNAVGQKLLIVKASTENEIDEAFAVIMQQRASALFVGGDPYFNSRRDQVVALAARNAIISIYSLREFALAGGLISYGTDVADVFRQVGVYTGRILKGAKPADLPVMQPTKFDLVINLKTAKALGLTIPPKLLARADEVIE